MSLSSRSVTQLLLWGMLMAAPSLAQAPHSVICEFEKIATAEVDAAGKIATGGESSSGQLVISNLDSGTPVASGNIGSVKLRAIARSDDAVSLVANSANGSTEVITLFLKTAIVMYTKHEKLRTATGDMPFGFVEVGRCHPPR